MRTKSNYRSTLHLVHDTASVDFYCGLARSDFGGNLLIQHTGDDESHNLLLPCKVPPGVFAAVPTRLIVERMDELAYHGRLYNSLN